MTSTKPERCITCGNEIPAGSGIHEVYEGQRLPFCSPECQAKFESDPERYIGETQSLARPPGYT